MAAALRLMLVFPWMAGLYGMLCLHSVDMNLGHSICGPWGCGPPTEALLGYHAFWLLLLVPLGVVAAKWLPPVVARPAGYLILALGCLCALGYVGWDAYRFYQQSQSSAYLLQRSLFVLATAVDFPYLQFALAGMVLLVCRRRPTASPFADVDSMDA